MFGGFGDDMGMGMGMDMGMGMGMDMGMGMGMGMDMAMMDMGMGMGGMGMGMGRQQIIVNNGGYGMGGGTTIIQQRNGLFGRQEEIIINNGGYGMGGGTTIIQQRGGLFGPREQIIINNNGYNNGYGMGRMCPIGCTCVICVPRRQQVAVCLPGCTCVICAPRRQQVVVCPAGCTCVVCRAKQPVHQTHHHHHHHHKVQQQQPPVVVTKPVAKNIGNAYNNDGIVVGEPVKQQQRVNKVQVSPYPTLGQYKQGQPQQQHQQTPEPLVNQNILYLKYGKWQGLRPCVLTYRHFDQTDLKYVKKIKCRTNLQPYSNSLEYGEIVMKVVIGEEEVFYAAGSKTLKEFFVKGIVAKMCPNFMYANGFEGQISGTILKKSQFLGNWQQRHVKITKQHGLKSYKNQNHNHTLHVTSTRELWTWFQVVQNRYIVVKLKNNKTKVEFGVPVGAQVVAWLEAFYGLLEDYD